MAGRKPRRGLIESNFAYSRVLAHGDDPYSDSETTRRQDGEKGKISFQTSSLHTNATSYGRSEPTARSYSGNIGISSSLPDYDGGAMTDEELEHQSLSIDEFGESQKNLSSRLVRTGRQRKKSAARSKGGEFQARRKKRRVYFCCVSSEIDVQKLFDYMVGAGGLMNGWKYEVYCDVLHLFKVSPNQAQPIAMSSSSANVAPPTDLPSPRPDTVSRTFAGSLDQGQDEDFETSVTPRLQSIHHHHYQSSNRPGRETAMGRDEAPGGREALNSVDLDSLLTINALRDRSRRKLSEESLQDYRPDLLRGDPYLDRHEKDASNPTAGAGGGPSRTSASAAADDGCRISGAGAQEVFVYDFGAVVFWGFHRGEETNILKTIRMYVTKGFVGPSEFHSGEDDMAFVTSPDVDCITIANDVITIPDDTPPKQRLSVSFAIAQSTVLAIFEARIEKKVEEYKYIPEALAAYGKVHLTERQLGQMIGEVFVIRHDVNLHTEILDTPDFFWKDGEKYEGDYKLIMRYLEMSQRTEVLNKRLDMLRELLDVLQQQMENAHAVKLEWIVIWLIVVEVILQVVAVGGESLGFWGGGSRSH